MSAIPANKSYNKLDLLRLMLLSREGDRREGILLRQSKGWFHIGGTGHEAIGALSFVLRPDDVLFPHYRDRALMLTRGLTTAELALAYFGKRDSGSGGRQMPGHYSNKDLNVFSVSSPTGGSLLPAVGTAWGMKLSGTDSLVVTSIGDAASRQGEFYEAVAFAMQEKLPAIFLVEDNRYGISTPTEKFLAFRFGLFDERNVVRVDAHYPDKVFEVGAAAAAKARAGDGPTILWCELDRLSSHSSSDDHRIYREPEDIAEMEARDPIKLLAEELMASGDLTEDVWQEMRDEVVQLVDAEYLKAEKATDPRADEVYLHNFGEEVPAERPPITTGRQTMVAAINSTLHKALENDPKVVMFGEDIEDPKGGVFGLTKGLSDAFPNQVFNSPLAEATIVGTAVGMAAYGMRPVFEVQFIDFINPAWNQIMTNLSTLRWRTFGKWKCPCVIYCPYGAYLPGGSLWHSQANEALLAHVPGVRIAIPSTPEDAAGLFWSAIHGDDPTFILIPKHIFRKNVEVDHVEAVPFGKARTVREGSDVTLVTWGNCVELAEEVAQKLADEVDIEILDLRTIVPCDYEAIAASLEKTGRLVVVHEDLKTCGFGQAILGEMTRVPERWNLFLSPPQLVAREDVHIGYNPIYEYAALPSADEVIAAVRVTME
ncbi:MAG: thiamine pyrophosphate-dependent enzyme [Fimbriimonadaceae bacterium]|nr:thiamine pyrophosphate-dependent enzyme [Fimbriimonadaceae bacterium]